MLSGDFNKITNNAGKLDIFYTRTAAAQRFPLPWNRYRP